MIIKKISLKQWENKIMSKVLLISPPYMQMSFPTYNMPIALTKVCKYMNPGLLITSSILTENAVTNRIIKIDNINDLSILAKKEIVDDTILVGISCTCAWEYLESLKIAEAIKKINPTIKTLISGWQIKSIATKVFEDSNDVDYIVIGDAENTIMNLFNSIMNNEQENIFSVIRKDQHKELFDEKKQFSKSDFKKLDFANYPNYDKYIPYVEESRNCPYSCQFCLNSCVNDIYQNVPFEIFKANVENIEKLYGSNANAILLAANFGVNPKETKRKLEYLKGKNLNWNIELHVDNPWEYYINDLKAAGVSKVSIGFESGSISTLKKMNKTKNPENYLKRLVCLLRILKEQNVSVNLNLLIDYRENNSTISETLNFLEQHKDLFKKVKANFMFAFEGIFKNIDFSCNPNIIIDEYGKKIHAYPILPQGYTLDEMSELINQIEAGNYSLSILGNHNIKRK